MSRRSVSTAPADGVKKEAAITRTGELSENDERLAVLSVLMMTLLERHRG